jgi:cyclase
MYRPRIIPCLLLKGQGLVKSIKFKDHRYIGDPINAVKIFNDKQADELIFLDVFASKENRCVSIDLVKKLGDECNMPFTVGGGVQTISQIKDLIQSGAEKVSINSAAVSRPHFIKEASSEFGSSTIVVSIDVKKKFMGGERVFVKNGSSASQYRPEEFARIMQDNGAGELLINSIEDDGMMSGYNTDLIKRISDVVDIPVIACGGAGSVSDLVSAVTNGGASASAAGSLFVFHGPRRAVLINLPAKEEMKKPFAQLGL